MTVTAEKNLEIHIIATIMFNNRIRTTNFINGTDPRMWDKVKKCLLLNSSKMNLTGGAF